MMREAHGARTQLMRIQAERRKRERTTPPATMPPGPMMQALPGAASMVISDPPAVACSRTAPDGRSPSLAPPRLTCMRSGVRGVRTPIRAQ